MNKSTQTTDERDAYFSEYMSVSTAPAMCVQGDVIDYSIRQSTKQIDLDDGTLNEVRKKLARAISDGLPVWAGPHTVAIVPDEGDSWMSSGFTYSKMDVTGSKILIQGKPFCIWIHNLCL